MKQIIILLFGILLISSCNDSRKEFNNSSKKLTTIELQEAPKDTIIVSEINNKSVYVFDNNNLVIDKYQIQGIDTVQITAGALFIISVLLFLFGCFIGYTVANDY